MQHKLGHAKDLIRNAVNDIKNIAVACSFGKDSMITVHIARQVDSDIPIFSVMTPFKPKETFEYLVKMDREMNLNTTIYVVTDEVPDILEANGINVKLLSNQEFIAASAKVRNETGKEIYEANPDECCRLLKVEPTKEAVAGLDAWICGLRNTEGKIRENYEEVESKGGLIKINPILSFTESEVLKYLRDNSIPLHPWYEMSLPDGRRYRSLGCAPCTKPVLDSQLEREGRWQNTNKCGGECGIHTQRLK